MRVDFLRPWIFLAGILVLPVFTTGAADSNWFARVWQSDDGLPDNSVTGVAQTDDGFLWVATQGGLARFDGIQFKRVSLPIVAGMPVEMIRALTVSRGNILWLALEGGIMISATPTETRVLTSSNGLPVIRPTSMVEDADGAIWVGYWDGTASRIAGNSVRHFQGNEGLPLGDPCSLTVDAQNHLWFTQAGRVGRFQDEQFVTLTTMQDRPVCITGRREGGIWICAGRKLFKCSDEGNLVKVGELSPQGEVVEPSVLFEDDDGALWAGTAANGLFRFDGTNVTRVQTSRGEIRSVSEDHEGNIWVGTAGGGLDRLRPRALQLLGVEQGLPFETVRSVCEEDDSGSLWVVTQNGFLSRSRGQVWSEISTNADWPRGQASCVASDDQGVVWVGTLGDGLYRWSKGKYITLRRADGLASDRIWALMSDSATNLWIALNRPNCIQRYRNGKFERFELPSGSHVVRAFAEDADHVVWMGTEDGHLLKIKDDALEDETDRTMARRVPIRCLEATSDGSVWIGYGGAGVGWLKGDRFERVGTEQGLPDDFISQILSDDRGNIWFAANRGVFSVKQDELEAAATGQLNRVRPAIFGKNEGLPSLQANFGFGLASVRMHDGRLCFSMLTGLAMVHPERVRINQVPPPVVIERVSVNNHTLLPVATNLIFEYETSTGKAGEKARSLEIPPRHRELKFDFNALSFASPENVRLRYQVEGYDQGWIETSDRSVTYSQMPAGHYQFRVTACNNSGVWNPTGAELDFTVRPFFWQTWWFRLGFVVLFSAGIVAVVRYISFRRLRRQLFRLEQEAAVQKDRARIAKDLHDDLGAHLSHIAMLSELAQTDIEKPVQAHGHLDQIFHTARLVTRSLDEIVWAVNPRNDSLDRFVAHICQFAPEFLRPAGIRSRLDMPMDLPEVNLAANVRHQLYLGFKEALNNIVKHAGATEVWLRLKVSGDSLILIIEDNGRGFETGSVPKSGEDGLMNLRHRMEDIGGRFSEESKPGQGTRITFVAPMSGKMF